MSAIPRVPLTPTHSPEGERELIRAAETVGASVPRIPASSLSRWRERVGVRVAVAVALIVIAVLVPILNLAVPQGNLFHLSDYGSDNISTWCNCYNARWQLDI